MENIIATLEQTISANRSANSKVMLLDELKKVIANYASLNREPFKLAIQNFIIRLTLNETGITLTQVDTDALWSID